MRPARTLRSLTVLVLRNVTTSPGGLRVETVGPSSSVLVDFALTPSGKLGTVGGMVGPQTPQSNGLGHRSSQLARLVG